MSSVETGVSAPTTEIKEEESTVPKNNAKLAPVPPHTESTPGLQPTITNGVTTEIKPAATRAAPAALVGLTKHDLEVMTKIVGNITDYRDADGHEVAGAFQRIVSKKQLPDYYEIIKEPVALSTIRGKLVKKQYKGFKEYVHDFARMCHNAQVYNRPSAQVYRDAIAVRELFKTELQKLVDENTITAKEAELEDFGELPPAEDSPPPGPDDEEAEEEDDEDDEDEEDDETDDDRSRRTRKKGRRSSALAKRDGKVDDGVKDDPEAQKKRGRPPKVHTPMEARINTLLKGLRKFKNPGGELKILHFERLPDKSVMPEYYQEIKNPIAMDLIKRKAKRKKYQSVDQALKDLELMFENAKSYNLEDSPVYRDAVDLQREARVLAEQEKKKPDSDFVDEDGRLPLPEILYEGELWKVGDWVHLTNNNDITKPIVAQIYRTWQDPEGQKWINACWYYRPEQTVHRYEKHFFENEVVKTGQYRDHKIEEVVDRCFVMFFTRYNKGRPRGFPADKEVYVCEARYNEEKFKLNKIKTWASCVPDEVREKDYEMDLFDAPRKMKKVPSPIKHLLREDAKDDDPLPRPTWGAVNAPPIVGAVHRRPRESNESPPPDPTPSPPPPSPSPVRRPVTSDRPRFDAQGDVSMSGTNSNLPIPLPNATQTSTQSSYGQQFAPARPSAQPAPLVHQNSYSSHGSTSHASVPPTHMYQPQNTFSQYNAASTPVSQHQSPLTHYNHYQSHTATRPVAQVSTPHSTHSNAYNPPRPAEAYILSDSANSSIPADVREQFQRDEFGRVIFFTTPPLDASPIPDEAQALGHSLRYLADRARRKEEEAKKRKTREAESEAAANERQKRIKSVYNGNKNCIVDQRSNAIKMWSEDMDKCTNELYQNLYGRNWEEMRGLDISRLAVQQEDSFKKQKDIEGSQKTTKNDREVKISGFKWI